MAFARTLPPKDGPRERDLAHSAAILGQTFFLQGPINATASKPISGHRPHCEYRKSSESSTTAINVGRLDAFS